MLEWLLYELPLISFHLPSEQSAGFQGICPYIAFSPAPHAHAATLLRIFQVRDLRESPQLFHSSLSFQFRDFRYYPIMEPVSQLFPRSLLLSPL